MSLDNASKCQQLSTNGMNRRDARGVAEADDGHIALQGFEDLVRRVTGREDYKFGDLSKEALRQLTGKVLQVCRMFFGGLGQGRCSTASESERLGWANWGAKADMHGLPMCLLACLCVSLCMATGDI